MEVCYGGLQWRSSMEVCTPAIWTIVPHESSLEYGYSMQPSTSTSRLDNWNALFYGLPQNQISRLQHIQNTAARVVTLSRKSCHITPILKELHWLPVSQRIVFKLMLIVHKSVNNIAPIYISELLKVYTPSRILRSSNMSLLKEPTSKRTWGDRSFSVAAPRLWNHLPTKLKSCHSKTRFKSLLKTHLMSQVYL